MAFSKALLLLLAAATLASFAGTATAAGRRGSGRSGGADGTAALIRLPRASRKLLQGQFAGLGKTVQL